MKKPELFNKSVSILTEAYFNDELQSNRCNACAVGNLIRGNGMKISRGNEITKEQAKVSNSAEQWLRYIGVYIRGNSSNDWLNEEAAKAQIKVTGYTAKELSQIENAFERFKRNEESNDIMFVRLMSVVEVLQEIHECSIEETVEAKGKFNKQAKQLV